MALNTFDLPSRDAIDSDGVQVEGDDGKYWHVSALSIAELASTLLEAGYRRLFFQRGNTQITLGTVPLTLFPITDYPLTVPGEFFLNGSESLGGEIWIRVPMELRTITTDQITLVPTITNESNAAEFDLVTSGALDFIQDDEDELWIRIFVQPLNISNAVIDVTTWWKSNIGIKHDIQESIDIGPTGPWTINITAVARDGTGPLAFVFNPTIDIIRAPEAT